MPLELTLNTVGECLADLLRRDALHVALRQRAKFEGWLKVELAHALAQRGASVALEPGIEGTRCRADMTVRFPEEDYSLLMLKTVNTNFRFPGVESRTRPITKNISGVIADLEKLRSSTTSCPRLVVFPLFPVSASELTRASQLSLHMGRVEAAGGRVERQGFVVPPCSDGRWGLSWFVVVA